MQSKEGKRPHVCDFVQVQPGTLSNPIKDCKYQVIHKAELSFSIKFRYECSEPLKKALCGLSFEFVP